ncbi:MAG: hypothetical protein ACRDFR_00260 [Candidatus Limnocylindria bacterium]
MTYLDPPKPIPAANSRHWYLIWPEPCRTVVPVPTATDGLGQKGTGFVRVVGRRRALLGWASDRSGKEVLLSHRLTRTLLALLAPVIVMIAFSASALAVGPQGKVDICHFANHKFVEISVSANAEPAHLAHGDVLTDEYGDCP